MADELAAAIIDDILRGQLQAGDSLPTEPELSEEFGVSRSVVRDAMRMLAARGLVTVHHGRGAFVTESQLEAFGDSLLLALRREGATVWEVEEFFELLWPGVYALAASRGSDDDHLEIQNAAERYLELFAQVTHDHVGADAAAELSRDDADRLRESFGGFTAAVLRSTHNALIVLLGTPVEHLRSLRKWDSSSIDAEQALSIEARSIHRIVAAIKARDPEAARSAVSASFRLPEQAVRAMRSTPVGEVVEIPVGFEEMDRGQL